MDSEENQELYDFFQRTAPPPPSSLVDMKVLAFATACDSLKNDDKEANIALLRCINVVVHAFEHSCWQPKKFTLKLDSEVRENLDSMTLSEAVQHLWTLDVNRLDPKVDYEINVQEGKKPYVKEDAAPDPLFTRIDERIFKQRPTYAAFCALLDNYSAETGKEETVTDAERKEVSKFLSAIMQTNPMQFCHHYCRAHDKNHRVPEDVQGFERVLKSIWFDFYSRERGGRLDSSGFEHVFVGEVKNGEVSGLHNWIQLAMQEKMGALDFRGYIKPKGRDQSNSDSDDHLLSIQFRWKGVEKFVGTSFIGTSPEFEMALYTMCFLVGEEENKVDLNTGGDTFGLTIKCYRFNGDKIGTTFPEVTSHYED